MKNEDWFYPLSMRLGQPEMVMVQVEGDGNLSVPKMQSENLRFC